MGTLFLSFCIAIAGAVGLVSLSRALDIEFYMSRVFPLIPILYAIIYNSLEAHRTGASRPLPPPRPKEEMRAGAGSAFRNIAVNRIVIDVAVSFGLKFSLEIFLLALFISVSGETLVNLYGTFGIETVGRFLRGDHPWLNNQEGLTLLAVLAVIMSLGTGIWIGYTAKGKAILEGVLAGAAVTAITAMTNMLTLYRRIEQAADDMAASFGYGIHVGFLAVLILQVTLYGLWSGIARRMKEEREFRAAGRKSVRKPRR